MSCRSVLHLSLSESHRTAPPLLVFKANLDGTKRNTITIETVPHLLVEVGVHILSVPSSVGQPVNHRTAADWNIRNNLSVPSSEGQPVKLLLQDLERDEAVLSVPSSEGQPVKHRANTHLVSLQPLSVPSCMGDLVKLYGTVLSVAFSSDLSVPSCVGGLVKRDKGARAPGDYRLSVPSCVGGLVKPGQPPSPLQTCTTFSSLLCGRPCETREYSRVYPLQEELSVPSCVGGLVKPRIACIDLVFEQGFQFPLVWEAL
jgi:hypothetical protein